MADRSDPGTYDVQFEDEDSDSSNYEARRLSSRHLQHREEADSESDEGHQPLERGDRVAVYTEDRSEYNIARISREHSDGTYKIVYEASFLGKESRVPLARIYREAEESSDEADSEEEDGEAAMRHERKAQEGSDDDGDDAGPTALWHPGMKAVALDEYTHERMPCVVQQVFSGTCMVLVKGATTRVAKSLLSLPTASTRQLLGLESKGQDDSEDDSEDNSEYDSEQDSDDDSGVDSDDSGHRNSNVPSWQKAAAMSAANRSALVTASVVAENAGSIFAVHPPRTPRGAAPAADQAAKGKALWHAVHSVGARVEEQLSPVLHQGMLQRKNKHFPFMWSWRFFQLFDRKMKYWDSLDHMQRSPTQPKGVVDLDGLVAVTVTGTGSQLSCLLVLGFHDQNMQLFAKTSAEVRDRCAKRRGCSGCSDCSGCNDV
jgi:hypothetical protein